MHGILAGVTRWSLRLIGILWIVMAATWVHWCYVVADRMWHGLYFAGGTWGCIVNFSTVALAPIGAVLVWRRASLIGSAILLFLAVSRLSDQLWFMWEEPAFCLALMPGLLTDLVLSLATCVAVGAHAVVTAIEEGQDTVRGHLSRGST